MRLIGALALVFFLISPAQSQPADTEDNIVHVLNRLTFGARPGDIERVKSLGIQGFIASQLTPQTLSESPLVIAQLAATSQLRQSSAALLEEYRRINAERKAARQSRLKASADGQPIKIAADKRKREIIDQQVDLRLIRAVESPRQLQELMTDFWFNHFNICINKGVDSTLVAAYEEQAIRPRVLGRFRDLLGATAHHPAMIFYLDNAQNSKPDFTPAGGRAGKNKNRKKGLNENYARELMELHTVGVDGGYTQNDVIALARVLTGWGMPGTNAVRLGIQDGYWASFFPARHDYGDKILLGATIKGSGAGELERALDMLARHPSTARHIGYKLAQYFVADKPPESLVNTLANRFTATDGNIKALLETLFSSPEFWSDKYRNSKFKSPFRYAVSVLRATGFRPSQPQRVQQFLRLQGQPTYACVTPDGYKNTEEAWLNPDGLLKRMAFATLVGSGRLRSASNARFNLEDIAITVNGGRLSAKTQQTIFEAPEALRVAALMGSPEFMRY